MTYSEMKAIRSELETGKRSMTLDELKSFDKESEKVIEDHYNHMSPDDLKKAFKETVKTEEEEKFRDMIRKFEAERNLIKSHLYSTSY